MCIMHLVLEVHVLFNAKYYKQNDKMVQYVSWHFTIEKQGIIVEWKISMHNE